MKATIEISDSLLKQAKNLAASKGLSFEQLLTKTLREKVAVTNKTATDNPWMKLFGTFGQTPAAKAETQRIQKTIDKEFEQIDPEDRD